MQQGFDPYQSISGYRGAVDTANESLLRKLSAQGGNPFGNPGGLIEAQKSVINGTALPAIQNYQQQNANTGGLSNLSSAFSNIGASAALHSGDPMAYLGVGAGGLAQYLQGLGGSGTGFNLGQLFDNGGTGGSADLPPGYDTGGGMDLGNEQPLRRVPMNRQPSLA